MSVSWLDIFFLHLWNTRGTAHTQSRPFTVNLSPQPSSFRDKFEIRKTKLKCNVSYIFNIQEPNYFLYTFFIYNKSLFYHFVEYRVWSWWQKRLSKFFLCTIMSTFFPLLFLFLWHCHFWATNIFGGTNCTLFAGIWHGRCVMFTKKHFFYDVAFFSQ